MDKNRQKKNSGQTLIETIVAIGILTTGIMGGVALAIASVGASDKTMHQIVATGLAREGAEVIRRIRDANWDNGSLVDCDSLFGTSSHQKCYSTWDNSISGSTGAGANYSLSLSMHMHRWTVGGMSNPGERIYLNTNGSTFYANSGTDWRYGRQVNIFRDTNAPFSASNPRIRVTSTVWWNDRQCPRVDDPALTSCKVSVQEYLTNWRNY